MKQMNCIFPILISLLCLTIGFVSCSEESEDFVYPPLLSEFADVCSDESGTFTHLLTDRGGRLYIVNSSEIKTDSIFPDTIFRTILRYELVENGGAMIYSWRFIPLLRPESSLEPSAGIKTDPLGMQSVWRGGKYLNLILLVKGLGGIHHFRVVEDSIIQSVSGVRTLYLRLCHDAANDVEGYTSKVFLSVALDDYSIGTSDSVKISIPTTHGWQQWDR